MGGGGGPGGHRHGRNAARACHRLTGTSRILPAARGLVYALSHERAPLCAGSRSGAESSALHLEGHDTPRGLFVCALSVPAREAYRKAFVSLIQGTKHDPASPIHPALPSRRRGGQRPAMARLRPDAAVERSGKRHRPQAHRAVRPVSGG
ncbi:hypothetical protein G6F57_018106 [Rhizopus arrhizus]|nr:hypothetical protein G6F57_018106 [Rhizopus arrhizus]